MGNSVHTACLRFQAKLGRVRGRIQEAEERFVDRRGGNSQESEGEGQAQSPHLGKVPGQIPEMGKHRLRQDQEAFRRHGGQEVRYRVRHLPGYLGWVDLDLGSSPGWWAATVATYCPSRMVEHPKS